MPDGICDRTLARASAQANFRPVDVRDHAAEAEFGRPSGHSSHNRHAPIATSPPPRPQSVPPLIHPTVVDRRSAWPRRSVRGVLARASLVKTTPIVKLARPFRPYAVPAPADVVYGHRLLRDVGAGCLRASGVLRQARRRWRSPATWSCDRGSPVSAGARTFQPERSRPALLAAMIFRIRVGDGKRRGIASRSRYAKAARMPGACSTAGGAA